LEFGECPKGYMAHADREHRHCASQACGENDLLTCCAELAKCTTFTCPEHNDPKPDVLCSGPACTAEECCSPRPTCVDFGCPKGYAAHADREHRHCANQTCGENDLHTCCSEVPASATCKSFKCAEPWLAVGEKADMLCKGTKCGDIDIPTCCQKRARCTTLNCPRWHTDAEDKDLKLCASFSCQVTDYPTCCQELANCTSLTCPIGTLNSKERRCKSTVCSAAVDEAYCCIYSTSPPTTSSPPKGTFRTTHSPPKGSSSTTYSPPKRSSRTSTSPPKPNSEESQKSPPEQESQKPFDAPEPCPKKRVRICVSESCPTASVCWQKCEPGKLNQRFWKDAGRISMIRGKISKKCLTVQRNFREGCHPVKMETCAHKPEQQFLMPTKSEWFNPKTNTSIKSLSTDGGEAFTGSNMLTSC